MSGTLHVLVNAKGGSGATTLAVELAKAAAREKQTVAVVDADLTGRRSMSAILDCAKEFAANRTMSIYSVARVFGVTAIELSDTLENAYAIRSEEMEKLAKSLMQQHRMTIVDCASPFTDIVRPFIQHATRIVIVMEPTMLGSNATRHLIGDLSRFGIPLGRICVATNLRSPKAEITAREIDRALGTVVGEIPRRDDRIAYKMAITELARKLMSMPEEEPLALRGSVSLPASVAPNATNGSNGSRNGHSNGAAAHADEPPPERVAKPRDERRTKLKIEITENVSKRIDVVAASRAHTDGQKIQELRAQINEVISQQLADRDDISLQDRAELQQEIIDELLGLGPLEDLMRDEKVTEIMVNGSQTIYIERAGKITLSDRTFNDERHLRTVIERIIAPIGRRVDESSPMVDARLPDGSRVNAIIEPLALNGSTVTIRRFSKKRLEIDDLVRFGSVPADAVGLLKAMVESRLNIVVSGGTGSGKTTFLNILSNFIPEGERIVTIEDAAELSLGQDHVVRLESRPSNLEGKGAISIRDLVKNSLRMRPDRIVVGECRSGEALDMLQAMNTGHDGSLTTLHANTPRDALARLETLVLMAGFDLPIRAIREQIASAVDAVVQIERLRDGSRRCTSITEVVGMEGDVVTMQELIKFQSKGIDEDGKVVGEFQFSGVQPHATKKFEEAGVHFDIRELSKLKPAAAAAW
jgi:pilus assembly protein CpaF